MSEAEVAAYLAAQGIARAASSMSTHQRRACSAELLYLHFIDPERPRIPRQRLDFSLFTMEKWRKYFRFALQHIRRPEKRALYAHPCFSVRLPTFAAGH